jgi:hypothetical protein
MKMHVVYDQSGKIIAASRMREGTIGGPIPVAESGQYSALLEVPQEHAQLTFHDLCRNLVVVEKAPGKPHLKAKAST